MPLIFRGALKLCRTKYLNLKLTLGTIRRVSSSIRRASRGQVCLQMLLYISQLYSERHASLWGWRYKGSFRDKKIYTFVLTAARGELHWFSPVIFQTTVYRNPKVTKAFHYLPMCVYNNTFVNIICKYIL